MTATAQRTLTLSCVILTMGNRPAEVIRAIDSVLAQHGAPVDLVVVGNGADVTGLPAGVRTVRLPENVGVAAGRNAGVAACEGDVVLFLDDDGWYPDTGLACHIAGRFAADPSLAVLSMQVVDPDGGPGARWHVPRLRAGDPERSSVVTTFLGGACAIRRSAFLEAGGLPDLFFYGHEETDLAWQLMDRGYRLEYDATARMCHHHLPNARHDTFRRQDGRNRVLLARRLASALRVHRIIQAVELSVLILLAAIADAVAGNLTATRVLTVAALVVGVLMTVAHLLAIVASRRLR